MTKNIEEVLDRVDWRLLKKQKLALVDIVIADPEGRSAEEIAALEGVINLIDALQDAVIEDGLFSIDDVFGGEEE